MKSRLKKGDAVIVVAGKDKGRQGTIKQVLKARIKKGRPNQGLRVLIEGINLIKKSVKANPNANQPGGFVEQEAPLFISKVAIYNSATGKKDGIRYKTLEDGTKVRVFKKTGESVDV